jgi:hypothetical protein|tara:strand:- start:29939 stop:30286 length:348 start_codon:yes stop_codon:yes gene_type:complete
MIKELIKLANDLDNKGFAKEADYLDKVIVQMSKQAHISGSIGDAFDIYNDIMAYLAAQSGHPAIPLSTFMQHSGTLLALYNRVAEEDGVPEAIKQTADMFLELAGIAHKELATHG